MQGASDAAGMMDNEDAGAGSQIPGGKQDGSASIEEIAQVIAAMVQSGELDQATAEQVLQELSQAEQGGQGGDQGPGEGAPAGGIPEGAAGHEAAEGPAGEAAEEEKKASALIKSLVPEFR